MRLPALRGGPEVLDAPTAPWRGASRACATLHELLAERGVADRVIFDLGLVRELGYYTGAVFEVYDPAVGFALGGGGRYDDLIGRFGRPPARLRHRPGRAARAPGPGGRGGLDERVSAQLTIAVPRGALFDETLDLLDRLGDRHRRGALATTASCCSPTPAS